MHSMLCQHAYDSDMTEVSSALVQVLEGSWVGREPVRLTQWADQSSQLVSTPAPDGYT